VRLEARAPGKVNLCLFVGGLREHGRHEVVTLLESVSLADELRLEGATASTRDEVACEGIEGPNLVELALGSLRAHGWDAPRVRVEIDKHIPIAGGMAGGSADAAAILRMALLIGRLRPGVVAGIAASLGADVPSQLAPGLTRASGVGDRIEPRAPIAPHAFVLLPMPARLGAAEVYAEADRLGLPRSDEDLSACAAQLDAALREPEGRLPDELLVNDLQPATLSLCGEVGDALAAAREAGADHAMVCGSGPTAAGFFWGADAAERAEQAAVALSSAYPAAAAVTPVGAEYGVPRPSSPSGTI